MTALTKKQVEDGITLAIELLQEHRAQVGEIGNNQVAIGAIKALQRQEAGVARELANRQKKIVDLEGVCRGWSAHSADMAQKVADLGDEKHNLIDELRSQIDACTPHLRERLDGTLESPADMLAMREREVLGLLGRLSDAQMQGDALRDLIAAALADARREGAEAMQAEAAKLARALPLYYGSGDDGADESLAQAIEELPLPTGPRRAVLLTDDLIHKIAEDVGMVGPLSRVGNAHETADKFARAIEAAVLSACKLEVPRG